MHPGSDFLWRLPLPVAEPWEARLPRHPQTSGWSHHPGSPLETQPTLRFAQTDVRLWRAGDHR